MVQFGHFSLSVGLRPLGRTMLSERPKGRDPAHLKLSSTFEPCLIKDAERRRDQSLDTLTHLEGRISERLNCAKSSPSKIICPEVGSVSRAIARPKVVLPQPLSPTRPSVSPGSIARLTPSTAFIESRARRKTPCWTGKCTFKSLTSISGLMAFLRFKDGGR